MAQKLLAQHAQATVLTFVPIAMLDTLSTPIPRDASKSALALLARQPLGQHAPAMELTSATAATLDTLSTPIPRDASKSALALLAQQPLGQHAPAIELTSVQIATVVIMSQVTISAVPTLAFARMVKLQMDLLALHTEDTYALAVMMGCFLTLRLYIATQQKIKLVICGKVPLQIKTCLGCISQQMQQ